MASSTTDADKVAIYKKLHKELCRFFKLFDIPEPSDDNVHKLFIYVAPCIGKDVQDLISIWKRRSSRSSNAQLIEKLRHATEDGGDDYGFIFHECQCCSHTISHDLNASNKIPVSESVNTLNHNQVDEIISSYLSEIKPKLEDLLCREEPVKAWVPDETLPYSEFLKNLKMPASASNGPDMLLHDLGNFKRNKQLQQRIKRMFQNSQLPILRVILNTSGAGKTRSVLEGLCQKWGLYLTCHVDTEARGSMDLENTINKHIEKDPCFERDLSDTLKFRTAHDTNCKIAGRRFTELILARLCILEFFCKLARDLSSGNLTDEHKRLWVFLQIRPSCIGGLHDDIFNDLTERIMGADSKYVEVLLRAKFNSLDKLLDFSSNRLYCVVDEVQVAATSLKHAFLTSAEDSTKTRPILRELALAIHKYPMNLTLTGTALDKNLINEIMASPVFKETGMITLTHFGAFNIAAEQIAYMKQFLPSPLVTSDTFQVLFDRVSFWLKGRYRITATYMKDLIITGFQRPHRMLNEFVRLSTVVLIPGDVSPQMSGGFCPTDHEEQWEEVPTLESTLRIYTAQYWMRSSIDPITADQESFELIACGFARYAENDIGNHRAAKITLDEPLVLLALGEWLQTLDVPLAETLRANAARAATEANGANGLEEYLALYFSAVFDDATPLKHIFQFHEDIPTPDWAERSATLVSLYPVGIAGEDGMEVVHLAPVGHHMRPSVTIGKDASSFEATLNWLHHNDRAPICFPDRYMGPDILFVLRLRDEQRSLIWVALQSKFSKQNILPSTTLRKAVPTVTPGKFYGLRVCSVTYPHLFQS
ncbi:hypothetical protein B0H15DRAFT_778576 [Mycena belliarum]|uniref:Uncharacterized protein n=1 Tax=Mycena belliarum TaxID=1033014 RepID=A0AAD6U505_9AGAR|nr:hypothetical protein B0H15DRAFT_778576 [Mycena belliae]